MKKKSFGTRRRKNFTIIELLVVISIISILAALLLPALKSAKETAASIHCMGNIRQIGTAMHTFSTDNLDRLPGGADSQISWHQVINDLVFGRNLIPRFVGGPGVSGNSRASTLYCKSQKLFKIQWVRCYAMGFYSSGIPVWNPYAIYSSIPNEYSSYSSYWLWAKITAYKKPSYKMIMTETEFDGDSLDFIGGSGYPDFSMNNGDYPTYSANNGFYSFRHKNFTSSNFLFLDNHVEALNRRDRTITTSSRWKPDAE